MGKDTTIEWADDTFNGWIGCTKVSPACDHCYAERDFDTRLKMVVWGKGQPRHRTSEATWRKPLKLDAEAKAAGCRRYVFSNSLSDVFDAEVPDAWRDDLHNLIDATPNLIWTLLTKRPTVAIRYITATMISLRMSGSDALPRIRRWQGCVCRSLSS